MFFLKQDFNNVAMCCMDMDVLLGSYMFYSYFFLMMVKAGSTCTYVNRAFTSYEVMHSSSSSLMFLTSSTKSLCVPNLVGECPSSGLGMLAISVTTPHVTALLLKAISLWGYPICGLWLAHRTWRTCSCQIYSFVSVVPYSSLWLIGS